MPIDYTKNPTPLEIRESVNLVAEQAAGELADSIRMLPVVGPCTEEVEHMLRMMLSYGTPDLSDEAFKKIQEALAPVIDRFEDELEEAFKTLLNADWWTNR